MYKLICRLGQWFIDFITKIGYSGVMLFQAIIAKPDFRHFPLVIQQIYNLAVRSLPIVLIAGFFIGAVLALQGYQVLIKFKAESFVGTMTAISVLRELAPVVTGLLYAGRAGSSLTAEIALMKSTEQLSSLEMMAVNPLRRIISPRFWASIISLPLLTIVFMAMGILASAFVGIDWKEIDVGDFWGSVQSYTTMGDFLHGFYKSIIFAIFISWVAVYKGYSSVPNSEGVSKATTDTVVISSLGILFIDLLITIYLFG
ncbi:lipid asymmetry maintenance ABC transporter permease subunit MlaE [Psittacicella hinzii]|uniref:Intermembrane phospholipid transport system permease protein MlaE n=1 Tax=Psittacicella hinzii TaxID=2028575 RepID=A0A3A1YPW5_9GAMM|nr:lipid asymmetry maintenance ABC transporter permease subunit MlaE [Psittacicella hinzii]RIY39571.1 ABC transporter permease [Psittacicella hinzii]